MIHQVSLALVCSFAATLFFLSSVFAQTSVMLGALRDNTLYEDAGGSLSNGAGDHLFVGKTAVDLRRRALVVFDVAGNIPAGSTIDSVKLTLFFSRTISTPQSVELRRVLADWGEGTSNAGGQEGMGAPATTDDATWLHTFFNTGFWTTAGGDYSATVSGTQTIGNSTQYGFYTWGSTSQMVVDVQTWLDNPSTNFGWILLGNESTFPTSKRFSSSENPTVANRPTLTVYYTELLPPAPPVLVAPPNGATLVSINPTLDWNPSANADTYNVQMSDDPGFSNLIVNQTGIVATSLGVTGLANEETYYWRVSATNTAGTGDWSEVWSFTTIPAVPTAPGLASPANGATGQPTTLLLAWHPAQGAESYQVQLALEQNFLNIVGEDSGLVDTARQINGLLNNTTYYWHVRGSNVAGSGDWSETWNFTTIVQLPSQVVLVLPLDGALITSDSALFVWRQGQPAVDQYWFELATDSVFSSPDIDSTIVDTTVVSGQLQSDQQYWWRVRAHNQAGWGPFSTARDFTVLITGVKENELPTEFSLSQNYPNPFNPSTHIKFGLPHAAHVKLEVFNLLGESVAVLLEEIRAAGYHIVLFEAKGLASGVYLYHLEASTDRANQAVATAEGISDTDVLFTQTRKLLLIR